MSKRRDHGGGVDAARAMYGGDRAAWLDVSTGINPAPYPVGDIPAIDWNALPDSTAQSELVLAAREFWNIPPEAAVLATPGASAAIARIPALVSVAKVHIPGPTYNEHAAAFEAHGWVVDPTGAARVVVHPNNPDGRLWKAHELPQGPLTIIDESFADVTPDQSLIHLATRKNTLVLKSFGKFWGLAGARLGFAIGDPDLINRLSDMLGPWPVSGPALRLGIRALNDPNWAEETRARLSYDAARLDASMTAAGAMVVGGTSLFRLYEVGDAQSWQDRFCRNQILARIFPYSDHFIRLGLPTKDGWARLDAALATPL